MVLTVTNLLCECGILCLVFFCLGSCQDFGYDGTEGPNHWGDKYVKCVGKHQSPIDIDERNVIRRRFLPLVFQNFDKSLEVVSLQNNGHTVLFKIKKGSVPTIHGGPLQGRYKFSQLHFHWGPNDTLGSENQIDHHSFPLELHMVLYNTKYNDMNEALDFTDGLTVLSFLYSATDEDNSVYDQFENGLRRVHNMSASIDISNFVSLNDFTTFDKETYFTYEGSLTTPPCSEVVTWIEFMSTIPLSKAQLNEFRSLYSKTGQLTHNYRPVQPIYDRLIYLNSAPTGRATVLCVIFSIGLNLVKSTFS